jgi:hypothetical protein
MTEPEVRKIAAWLPWSQELMGDLPPYTHTFTPDVEEHWSTGTDLEYPETDDEWQAVEWFEENDPETATPYTHPPTLTIERTEWVDEEGAHVLAVEGEPTTPTMFIPLDREARP